MIPEERESIKEMYVDFLDNVHIDPEFLGPLIQDGVLTETMVAMIQVILCAVCYVGSLMANSTT